MLTQAKRIPQVLTSGRLILHRILKRFSSYYVLSNFISCLMVTINIIKNNKEECSEYVINLSFSAKVYLLPQSITDMAWDRYVTPFSYGLWLVAATIGCALGVCLALANFSNKSNQSLSLIATVFYIPSCFCQQGQKANPSYEFFIFSLELPVAKFFFSFLLSWALIIFFCHSYLFFCTCPCPALIY